MEEFINKKSFKLILFFVALFICTSNIWGPSIYILDEAKNAECAREMLEKQDLIVPTFNYELRTDKPPLHYFFMMIAYSLFGVSAFAARFFSSLMGALTILSTFHFGRKYFGANSALWTVLILLSSAHFMFEFHLAVPDPYLIFFFSTSLFLFYDYYSQRKKISLWGFYVCIALATLAKGPVAIGLAGLIILIFLISRKQLKWSEIKAFNPFTGALLVLLIAAPWYILVGIKTNWEWLIEFFLQHNLDRFADPKEGHGGSFLLTPLFILVGLLPFSMLFANGIKSSWKQKQNPFVLFSLIAASVITLFFSIASTKLPNYPMPSYPFWAIILSMAIPELKTTGLKRFFTGNIIIGLLLIIGGYFALKMEETLHDIVFLPLFLLPISIVGGICLFLAKTNQKLALRTFVSGWVFTGLVIFYYIYPKIYGHNPVDQSMAVMDIKQPIAYYERFNSAYSFAVKKEIPRLESHDEIKQFIDQNPKGYIISRTRYHKEFEQYMNLKVCFQGRYLFERPEAIVYEVAK